MRLSDASSPAGRSAAPPHSFATSRERDARAAAAEIADQIGPGEPPSMRMFFAGPGVDFPELAGRLEELVPGPSLGCTTAGELVPSEAHAEGGVVAVAVRDRRLELRTRLIADIGGFDPLRAISEVGPLLAPGVLGPDAGRFGLLLVDGLSMSEEQVCGSLSHALREVPFAGGSAADGMAFESTWVSAGGVAMQRAAAFGVVHTTLPFRVFQSHHFEATDRRLVITRARPELRQVLEINGRPAAEGYAEAIGLGVAELTNEVFAEHPVMLSVGGEYFMRSIQRVNGDESLTFFCAIDEGLVLRVARGAGLCERLGAELEATRAQVGEIGLLIGFDCILRRLELNNRGLHGRVRELLGGAPLIGFSTYGEQYNGLHINQTLTGVAIGAAA